MKVKLFPRTDTSILSQWWWTVDRWTVMALGMLSVLGFFLTLASSPSVAERLHLDTFYFVKRHGLYVLLSVGGFISISLLSVKSTQRFALALYLLTILLLLLVPFFGVEIKGARRWVVLGGVSIQPSEFMKPALSVLCAWMLSEEKKQFDFPGSFMAFLFYAVGIGLLILQPDFGMAVLISVILFGQFFLNGLSFRWIVSIAAGGFVPLGIAYFTFPHVASRFDRFFNPGAGDKYSDQYQITQSLEAFNNGGLFGQGPGEGVIKNHLPDAHADFIFAVAGEEFGLIFCLLIVGLFAFVTLRCLVQAFRQENLFILLAVAGLIMQFGLQALINMASTLHLIPTKGMTLPFISYGGSSMLSLAVTMGMVLGLTRRRILERG